MKTTDVSRQRQERVRQSRNVAPEPRSATPISWVLIAILVIGLAAAAIMFMEADEPRSPAGAYAESAADGQADREPVSTQSEPAALPPLVFPEETSSADDEASIAPRDATPDQIAGYQERLAERIAARRQEAVRGDVLDEELVVFLEGVTRGLLEGEGGDELVATLRESNPGYELEEGEVRPQLVVNSPYPAESPLSTVPPRLLKAYPPLPDGIEYRFVGCRLVLLDRDARLILDYTERCLW